MKKAWCNEESMRNWGLLFLRIAVGAVFIYHGWTKLTGIEQTVGFFGKIGIPFPVFSAWLVGLVEFIGGLAVLLGFYIRFVAKLLVINMIVALLTAHLGSPWKGAELAISMLGSALALWGLGGGKWQVWKKECLPFCNACPTPEKK